MKVSSLESFPLYGSCRRCILVSGSPMYLIQLHVYLSGPFLSTDVTIILSSQFDHIKLTMPSSSRRTCEPAHTKLFMCEPLLTHVHQCLPYRVYLINGCLIANSRYVANAAVHTHVVYIYTAALVYIVHRLGFSSNSCTMHCKNIVTVGNIVSPQYGLCKLCTCIMLFINHECASTAARQVHVTNCHN